MLKKTIAFGLGMNRMYSASKIITVI